MLDAMWKMCPNGGFKARVNDNPNQEFLIEPRPNLEPLKQWLGQKYSSMTVSVEEIYSALNEETFYLKKHFHEVLKELHKNGQVTGPEKLIFSHNPQISFAQKKTRQLKER